MKKYPCITVCMFLITMFLMGFCFGRMAESMAARRRADSQAEFVEKIRARIIEEINKDHISPEVKAHNIVFYMDWIGERAKQ
jgi:hypothetical protein